MKFTLLTGLSIPLPIILYTAAGLDIFSYSNFLDEHHEPHTIYTSGNTGNSYAYHHGHVVMVNDAGEELAHEGWSVSEHSFMNFSITKNVAGIFLALVIMFWVFLSAARGYTKRNGKAPKGIQSMMEPLILFIRDEVAKPSIGHRLRAIHALSTKHFLFHLDKQPSWVDSLSGWNEHNRKHCSDHGFGAVHIHYNKYQRE